MKSVVLSAVRKLELVETPPPAPKPGEVVVALKAAALNHRDEWIRQGQYAGLKFPVVLGSDGAGVVAGVGDGVDPSWLGREVIINPSLGWGASERVQGLEFSILGLPANGTLAEQVVVPASQLAVKPRHLSWEEAAALPLAGLTAYRAVVSRARTTSGNRVLVSGIGGGTALFALQVARSVGARVWVTSGSREKIEKAIRLGAEGGFLYSEPNWIAAAREAMDGVGSDVIVDSAGGAGFDALLDLAAPGARIVFFGGTRGPVPNLVPRKVFWKQLDLLGTTMGSPADWAGFVALVDKVKLHPVVSEVFPLAQVEVAFGRMEAGAQFGKLVVRIS
ncbi:zinc-binding dehydrogenase [Nibricoccus sp. IMCC34717]|uniref:zinc-binding dehydrogenase n=1 Tax=Nibricoccus sp. IMCC34717 TaxID=3034021 RepID=UPI00384B806B